MKVQALQTCYYDDKRYRVGDVFTISGERHPEGHARAGQLREFSSRYMELVPEETPERITTGAEVLKQEHDQIAGGKRVEGHPEAHERPSDRGVEGDEDQ